MDKIILVPPIKQTKSFWSMNISEDWHSAITNSEIVYLKCYSPLKLPNCGIDLTFHIGADQVVCTSFLLFWKEKNKHVHTGLQYKIY